MVVKGSDDVAVAARNFVSERLCPIFQVSNVTGKNLDHLKAFLNLLQVSNTLPCNLPSPPLPSPPGQQRLLSPLGAHI